jgi:hypothetical protein
MNKFEKEINGLELYLGNEDQSAEVTLSVINKLRLNLEYAKNTDCSNDGLRAEFFEDNDPLDISGAIDLPEIMRDEVSEIQH